MRSGTPLCNRFFGKSLLLCFKGSRQPAKYHPNVVDYYRIAQSWNNRLNTKILREKLQE